MKKLYGLIDEDKQKKPSKKPQISENHTVSAYDS
jgi:hypothetical protein